MKKIWLTLLLVAGMVGSAMASAPFSAKEFAELRRLGYPKTTGVVPQLTDDQRGTVEGMLFKKSDVEVQAFLNKIALDNLWDSLNNPKLA